MIQPLTHDLRMELVAAAASSGCELLQAELRGTHLQVILDREGGVTLADCEQVSRKMSAVLDTMDFGTQGYVLEVSSPGLDRRLYGPTDFRRFTGQLARVTWSDSQGAQRTDVGRLETFEEEHEELVLRAEKGASLRIPLDAIREARLEIEI